MCVCMRACVHACMHACACACVCKSPAYISLLTVLHKLCKVEECPRADRETFMTGFQRMKV